MNASPANLRKILSRLGNGVFRRAMRRRTSSDLAAAATCDGANRIRVASYNVHKCIGTDGTFDPARTASVIAEIDADIIALQEADKRLGSKAGRLNLTYLEHETGLRLIPLAARPRSHGWHGNALFVRCGTIIRSERITLPHAEPRGAILVEIDLPTTRLRVVSAHLGLLRQTRSLQLERLKNLIEAREPMPTLLMGDFNEWHPNRRNSPFDCLRSLFGPVEVNLPSFPSRRPLFPLDRIFATPREMIVSFAVHDTPRSRRASDHLPVKAVIELRPD